MSAGGKAQEAARAKGGVCANEGMTRVVLEIVLLQLGTSAAKAVARMWIKSETGTDLAEGLIDQLSSRIPLLGERRRTARQFQDMADRIADQLTPMVQSEYGERPQNELEAAVLAVSGLIESVQELEGQQLFSIDLDPVALEELFRAQPRAKERDDLIPAGQLVFDRLLRENCTLIIELTMSMPQFAAAALVELLRRDNEIARRVQQAFERIPQPAALRADADQEFSVRYRRHIAREQDRLELFGLTLSDSSSRYDLSIAYITLSATTPSTRNSPEGADLADSEIVEPAIGGDDEDTDDRKVDDALAAGPLHLVRGEAGSGKTTLLQWLAVTACRQSFVGALEPWSECLPFFLQLRRYANKPLPKPEDFLEHTASTIAGVMPPGWSHRQLESGKALLLIDGVDELPEHQRTAAREWLLSLLREFPSCRYVVTTRPPAVPQTWLAQAGFLISELLPMSFPDITRFVQHWYDAARSAVTHSASEVATLNRYQSELLRVIRESSAIRALATAPLLCAMLCALNRDRRTQLPRDRMELYRIALESLLDRRDVEREISQHDSVVLGLRMKETLLQDLAYWLILNEKTDITKQGAVARVNTRLSFMTSITASADAVFTHLLVRSGLIREPVEGRIDFIHRTFQEYLGAARAVSEGNIPLLVSKAHDDQWREVVILSAGHATVQQRDELIIGLIRRGEEEEDQRHKLHLLAVACLETALELSPDTVEAVNHALAAALPPLNMTDARAVASAGPLAAGLLGQFSRGNRATVAAACVRALCLIGGDEALAALAQYKNDRRLTVIKELLRGWDSFDRELYAKEVLSAVQLGPTGLELSDPESLRYVHLLPLVGSVSYKPSASSLHFDELPNGDRITQLEISRAWHPQDLPGVASLTSLRNLKLSGIPRLERLPELPESLRSLTVEFCGQLEDFSALAQLPHFERLSVTLAPIALDAIRDLPLRWLHLRLLDAGESDWLASMQELQSLELQRLDDDATEFQLGLKHSAGYLHEANKLQRLVLSPGSDIESFDGLPRSLRELVVSRATSLSDASALAQCPDLRMLTINDAPNLTDFNFLNGLTELWHVNLAGCGELTSAQLVAPPRLGHLRLLGTAVDDISVLSQCQMLLYINLMRSPVRSLEPLLDIPGPLTIALDESQAELVTPELDQRFRIVVARRMPAPPRAR